MTAITQAHIRFSFWLHDIRRAVDTEVTQLAVRFMPKRVVRRALQVATVRYVESSEVVPEVTLLTVYRRAMR